MPLADARPWHPHLKESWDSTAGSRTPSGDYLKHGVHDVMADWLEEHDDPRARIVRARWGYDKQAGQRPSYAASKLAGDLVFASHGGGSDLPDGSHVSAYRYAGPRGTHWAVEWHPLGSYHSSPGYETHMPEAEFKTWVKGFGEHARGIVKAIKPMDGKSVRLRWRLARERAPGTAAGIRDRNSANHEKRVEIAKTILNEAGLNPAVVRAALAHDRGQAQAAVVQIVRQRVDPARVRFAAAWYGLVSNSPAVTVFHPTESGEDSLHVINSPHPSEHVSAYLRRAGVPKFTTESHGAGTRVYVFDAGSQLDLAGFARGLDASHSKLPGVGYRLGSGPGADAGGTAGSAGSRATYRAAVRDFEASARG